MKLYLILVLTGLVIGFALTLWLYPKPSSPKPIVTHDRFVVHDTIIKYKDFASTSEAKTRYVPSPGKIAGTDPSGNIFPDSALNLEKVSYWDTNDVSSGFWAHIEYWHKRDQFKTDLHIPVTLIIDKDSSNTALILNPETIRELPKWELGIGLNTRLFESKFLYNPFVSLTYNKKIWFIYSSLEFRGFADFKNGNISLSPEIEGKLKFSL